MQLHKLAEAPIARAQREVVVRVLDDRLLRVLLVLHGQIKMRLARPPLREGDRIGNIEVDRELLHVVAIREEQDAPASNRERERRKEGERQPAES